MLEVTVIAYLVFMAFFVWLLFGGGEGSNE